jgi:hypothetical protein
MPGEADRPAGGAEDSPARGGQDIGGPPPRTNGKPASEAFRSAAAQVQELREFAAYLVAAKLDGIKVSLRNAVLYAGLGVVGLIALSTLISTAVVLVCVGMAIALAALFGSWWAGVLVAGVLILWLIFGGGYLGMVMITRSSRERTVRKYEQRKQQQRAAFGRDVHQRSGHSGG